MSPRTAAPKANPLASTGPDEVDMVETVGESGPVQEPSGPDAVKAKAQAKDRAPRKPRKTSGTGKGAGGARPGAGRPSAASTQAKTTKEIGDSLGRLLALPAVPAAMTGQPFLVEHFDQRGPALGMMLAQYSETDEWLRSKLLLFMAGDAKLIVIMGLLAYALPPVLYMATSDDNPIRGALGVPPRPSYAPTPTAGPGGVGPTGHRPEDHAHNGTPVVG